MSGLRSPEPADAGGGAAQLLPSSTPIAGALLADAGGVGGAAGAVSTGAVAGVVVEVVVAVEAPAEALVHVLIGLRASPAAPQYSSWLGNRTELLG